MSVRKPSIPRVRLHNVSLPKVRKEPAGWGNTEITVTTGQSSGASNLAPQPVFPPMPEEWKERNPSGTVPEWAIFWALLTLGYEENSSFYYQPSFSQQNVTFFTTLDFFLPDEGIGIEIQGEYWHYEQGPDRILKDIQRQQVLAGYDIEVIFIDAEDAETDPIYYAKEAIQGIDHSALADGRV